EAVREDRALASAGGGRVQAPGEAEDPEAEDEDLPARRHEDNAHDDHDPAPAGAPDPGRAEAAPEGHADADRSGVERGRHGAHPGTEDPRQALSRPARGEGLSSLASERSALNFPPAGSAAQGSRCPCSASAAT